jgi:hypothetical protein
MPLGSRAHSEKDVVTNEYIAAVEAGHRQKANGGKKASVMGQDVFEDLA